MGSFLYKIKIVVRFLIICVDFFWISFIGLGFFFCGMMLFLVDIVLLGVKKLNFFEVYSIYFLVRCERWIVMMEFVFSNLIKKLWFVIVFILYVEIMLMNKSVDNNVWLLLVE